MKLWHSRDVRCGERSFADAIEVRGSRKPGLILLDTRENEIQKLSLLSVILIWISRDSAAVSQRKNGRPAFDRRKSRVDVYPLLKRGNNSKNPIHVYYSKSYNSIRGTSIIHSRHTRGKIDLENIYKGSTDCREKEAANRVEVLARTPRNNYLQENS